MKNQTTKTIACALAGLTLSACAGADAGTDAEVDTNVQTLFDYPTLSHARDNDIINTFVSTDCETDYCIYNIIDDEIDFMTASLGSNIILGAPITDIGKTGTLTWDASGDFQEYYREEVSKIKLVGSITINLSEKTFSGLFGGGGGILTIDGKILDNQTIEGQASASGFRNPFFGISNGLTGIVDETKMIGIFINNSISYSYSGGFTATRE